MEALCFKSTSTHINQFGSKDHRQPAISSQPKETRNINIKNTSTFVIKKKGIFIKTQLVLIRKMSGKTSGLTRTKNFGRMLRIKKFCHASKI